MIIWRIDNLFGLCFMKLEDNVSHCVKFSRRNQFLSLLRMSGMQLHFGARRGAPSDLIC